MRRSTLLAALICAVPAAAQDFQAPRFTLSDVDWDAAAKAVAPDSPDTTADIFRRLNRTLSARFPGIDKSSVPVLLPIDVATFRKDIEANVPETSNRYFGDFAPSKLFLAGPAGYDATFWINPKDAGLKFTYPRPVEVEITGAAFVYELNEPDNQQVFSPAKDLAEKFPGMRRIIREGHIRFAFERFGVPYVMSIQCYDRRPSRRFLTCREADQVAQRFLTRLEVAGGTPSKITQPTVDISRPDKQSEDFSFHSPGDLIPGSGYKKLPGRADYTVYARYRFPIANAPAYVKSQSFMPWGDCYRSGHVGRIGRKDAPYRCRVNDIPLTFNEAAAVNFNYPWRDNFCELRDFHVGQCPGGHGHQAQDMRPANCVLFNEGADRCQPYHHTIAAVHDGVVWRAPGNLSAFILWNTADEHVRVTYLHMNPKMMDDDGVVTGRLVSEGEIIGKVANWGDYENGTSYHLHFAMQVFTRNGWVWVNPYATLVASYERMIGGRGREIRPGETPPPTPEKSPIVLNPSPVIDASAKPADVKDRTPEPRERPAQATKPIEPKSNLSLVKEEKPAEIRKSTPAKKNRPVRRRRRRRVYDEDEF